MGQAMRLSCRAGLRAMLQVAGSWHSCCAIQQRCCPGGWKRPNSGSKRQATSCGPSCTVVTAPPAQVHRLATAQLAAGGTKELARLRWPFFGRNFFILKIVMFHDLTTVLNERKHLKMLIRSVPDSVSLIVVGRAECLGLIALHCTIQL
jgi:hypothetical protein